MDRDFNFHIPLDVFKDKKGNWKLKGLASTGDKDLQGEILKQNGLDISVLKAGKGYLNWEHKSDPKNIIGLIDNADITQKGLVVEGHLFKKHDQAKAVYQILDSLPDDKKHRIQMSVEGKVISKSDGEDKNTKIIDKARITAVALTMNPVNQSTYTELVKSLIHEGEVSMGDEFPSSFSSSTSPLLDKEPNDTKLETSSHNDPNNQYGEGDIEDQESVAKISGTEETLAEVTKTIGERMDERKFEKAVDYFIDSVEDKELDFDVAVEKLNVILKEDLEGQRKFQDFIKSLVDNPFAEEILKAVTHKYVKREKRGGKWIYWYKDSKGKLVTGKKPSDKKESAEKKEYSVVDIYHEQINMGNTPREAAENALDLMSMGVFATMDSGARDKSITALLNKVGEKVGEKYAAEQIAQVTLEQLGGQHFIAMTGAKHIHSDESGGLTLKFRGSNKFNALKVKLNSMDTYDMTFYKIGRAPKFKTTQKEINGVYNDQLQGIFTEETGLYTSLGTMGDPEVKTEVFDYERGEDGIARRKSQTVVDFMKANIPEEQWEEFVKLAKGGVGSGKRGHTTAMRQYKIQSNALGDLNVQISREKRKGETPKLKELFSRKRDLVATCNKLRAQVSEGKQVEHKPMM